MVFTPIDVEKEYEKDIQLKKEDVTALMEWASKQAHLPKITELQAILFLHSCFYRVEPAKATLENFFTMYTLCKEIFIPNLNDQQLKDAMKCSLITVLPKRTAEGHRIIFMRLMDDDINLYHFIAQHTLASLIPILDLHLNGTCPGYITIIDGKDAHLGHMTKFNINVARKYLFLLQEGVPYRLQGFHIINILPWFEKLLGLTRPFMKKELYEMIHLHGDIKDLYKYVPIEVLPENLGGDSPSFSELQKSTNELIKNNIDLFREIAAQTVNESKRQAKLKNELFGIEGSFKKLDFD